MTAALIVVAYLAYGITQEVTERRRLRSMAESVGRKA